MAALTATQLTKRLPLGDRVIQFFSVTSGATAAAADEYVLTGLSYIDYAFLTAAPGTASGAVAASATVTFGATDPTDEDTITVDGIVYTIQDGLLAAGVYDVDMSGTEATMAANFAHAINRTGVPGTAYSGSIAPHPTVKATYPGTGGIVTLTARVPGAGGNAITLAESSTGAVVSGANLSGGLDAAGGAAVNFVLNALGTGQAADSTPGALGIESTGVSQAVRFCVIGRP